ncbi:ExbD/TolR family protein [Marichromatium bheemlicum]|uniref:Biopolymer transporter ExbD n=1 Tax=Marichromatium bheemlicum TaxID=365339 RepID=A0ABX1I606_9GAMM|nr:biopolymer transporter ExbD [Marichromatium bheemlicum]NKN31662.1 biopolymer transporter ExbD [Marichromatium bheemlicum]
MQIPAPPRRGQRDPMSGLVDVVLLLLVFFLLVGTLETPSPLSVTPPEAAPGEPLPDGRLRLVLAADGRIALAGVPLTRAELDAEIAARLADEPGRTIAIEADANTPSGTLLEVLAILRAQGIDALSLITRESP